MARSTNPDYILIDLDPQECAFSKIVEAALLVKGKLDAVGLAGYPKTTGGDGMHIYVPIENRLHLRTGPHVRRSGCAPARRRAARIYSPRPAPSQQREKDRVYFDYLQIGESKTISAPYVAAGLHRSARFDTAGVGRSNDGLHPVAVQHR